MTEWESKEIAAEVAAMRKPLPVAGYVAQSTDKVALVNANKIAEEAVLRILDGRWLAIGCTHIEQGFMAVNRAVFQPQRVQLQEDV